MAQEVASESELLDELRQCSEEVIELEIELDELRAKNRARRAAEKETTEEEPPRDRDRDRDRDKGESSTESSPRDKTPVSLDQAKMEEAMESLYAGRMGESSDDEEDHASEAEQMAFVKALSGDREVTDIEREQETIDLLRWQLAKLKRHRRELNGDYEEDQPWIAQADGRPWDYLGVCTRSEEAFEWAAWSVWTRWAASQLPKDLDEFTDTKLRGLDITTPPKTDWITLEQWRPVEEWVYGEDVESFLWDQNLAEDPGLAAQGAARALGWPGRPLRRRRWARDLVRRTASGLGPLATAVFDLNARTKLTEIACKKLAAKLDLALAQNEVAQEESRRTDHLRETLAKNRGKLDDADKIITVLRTALADVAAQEAAIERARLDAMVAALHDQPRVTRSSSNPFSDDSDDDDDPDLVASPEKFSNESPQLVVVRNADEVEDKFIITDVSAVASRPWNKDTFRLRLLAAAGGESPPLTPTAGLHPSPLTGSVSF